MEKISLKLYEFYNLDSELNGVINQQNGEKISSGLLAEKLKLTTKYWLTELSKKVAAEKAVVETLKEELIKKHGETDESGNISIPMYINIVKDNGKCVGWAVIKQRKSHLHLKFKFEFMVYIKRKYRRKGIGTKLYNRAKKFFDLEDKDIKVYITTNYNSEFFDKVRKV